MSTIKYFVLAAAGVFVFTACGESPANKPSNNANAANTTVKTAAAGPSKEDLIANEEKAWRSWKAKDGKYFEEYLTDTVVGMGNNGRADKAAIVKRISDPACELTAFSFSEQQMTMLGPDAALLAYKATQDAKCGGRALPDAVRAATVLVRSGDKWKAAFHAEAEIVDPKAGGAKPPQTADPRIKDESKTTASDALTDALAPKEKALWEAWKDHDGTRIDELTTKEISFINIFGTYFASKADALKDWTSPGCDVKSVSVTGAQAVMFAPTAALLTFNGGADGTCFGQKVGPIRGSSIYVKEGDSWKWTFGINLPAH